MIRVAAIFSFAPRCASIASITNDGLFPHRRPTPDSRHGSPVHGSRSAPERSASATAKRNLPADELRKLGELGCCGMLIPEDWGGAGADTISYVLMLEEVARVDAAMAVALSVTNSVACLPLSKYGTEAQKQKYLLEPGARRNSRRILPHRAASRLRCRRARKRARRATATCIDLNGTKSWVTNGGEAGLYVVFAKTDPSAGAQGVTAFLVEPHFPVFA